MFYFSLSNGKKEIEEKKKSYHIDLDSKKP